MSARSEMTRLSREIARRIPAWTQGFGGNVSKKFGTRFAIKATGVRLDAVSEEAGSVVLDLDGIRRKLAPLAASDEAISDLDEEAYSEILKDPSIVVEGSGRPSMETGFHALLPRTYVIHFHSLAALLMAHARGRDPKRMEEWLAANALPGTVFLPCTRPGWKLARSLAGKVDASVIILENHGVILHADRDSILDEWSRFESRFCGDFGYVELDRLAKAPNPLAAARAVVDRNHVAPLKIYFPDTAVYFDRLSETLVPRGSGFFLPEETWRTDPNLGELWLATALLYRLEPELAEVPASIAAEIVDLPVELVRRRITDGKGPK